MTGWRRITYSFSSLVLVVVAKRLAGLTRQQRGRALGPLGGNGDGKPTTKSPRSLEGIRPARGRVLSPLTITRQPPAKPLMASGGDRTSRRLTHR